MKVEIKTPPPVVQPPATVLIEMTEDEAIALRAFCSSRHNCRNHTIVCMLVDRLPAGAFLTEHPYYKKED